MQVRLRPADDSVVAKLATTLRVKAATARSLAARGVLEPQDAQGFIDPRLAALRPPTGLAGMTKAVTRIADAVLKGETIGVFGDYDVDGVTTAALLTSFLRGSGATVAVAVARRDAGYGFTPAAATDFADRNCHIIVTGDCGTSDLEAIRTANARGLEVIIVDHHTVPSAVDSHPAYALVNPFRHDSTFPFRGMASVGLMFYVAAALRTELRARDWYASRPMPDVRDLLDLVALGTIADLVPLTAENRILTSLGLRRLQTRARPGIAALLGVANVKVDSLIDSRTVGWKLGPRINAPGRLGAAEPSLSLLLADAETAGARAEALEAMNTERREIQGKVVDEAIARLDAEGAGDPGAAIVIAGEGWAPGVVGIVAAKLVERYGRPAFVIGVDPVTGLGRGSARTTAGVDLYKTLTAAKGHLDRYGGHAAAAGFTIQAGSIDALREALGDAVAISHPHLAQGSGPVGVPAIEIDAEVRLNDIDERLAQELADLGPFGQANPNPMLVARDVRVTSVRRVGTDNAHLKLSIEDDQHVVRHAIGWRLGDREVAIGDRLDLAFVPKISTYQGRTSAELELSDLAPTA